MSAIVNEPERVILVGEWGEEIVRGWTWSDNPNASEFESSFEIVEGYHQAGTDYYQGLDFMALIRRKSDGKMFGYPYWKPVSKYGEAEIESNGDEHGFETTYNADYTEVIDGPYWVWLPVAPFTITGWRIAGADQ